jgi:hypothetical protein
VVTTPEGRDYGRLDQGGAVRQSLPVAALASGDRSADGRRQRDPPLGVSEFLRVHANPCTAGAGDRFAGPAVVTQLDATTLIAPGWYAEALASGAMLLRRG